MFFDRSTSSNITSLAAVRGREAEPPLPDASAELATIDSTPNVRQFLLYLQGDVRSLTRAETVNAVVAVTPAEVERVARTVARLRGRYLAQILDLGHANRPPLTDADIGHLRRAREWYEEVERGFAELRAAIETGEVPLDGVRRD